MFIDGDPFFKLALLFVAGVAVIWAIFQIPDFLSYLAKDKGDKS